MVMRIATVFLVGAIALGAIACGQPVDGVDTFSPPGSLNLHGKVVLGPMCPVLQENSPCPARPIRARVWVRFPDRGIVVTDTDAHGRFQLQLGPGGYEAWAVAADSRRSSKTTTFRVTSRTGVTNLIVTVDSGIR
jgi:hypothetical protein